jgi:hypothetical protein
MSLQSPRGGIHSVIILEENEEECSKEGDESGIEGEEIGGTTESISEVKEAKENGLDEAQEGTETFIAEAIPEPVVIGSEEKSIRELSEAVTDRSEVEALGALDPGDVRRTRRRSRASTSSTKSSRSKSSSPSRPKHNRSPRLQSARDKKGTTRERGSPSRMEEGSTQSRSECLQAPSIDSDLCETTSPSPGLDGEAPSSEVPTEEPVTPSERSMEDCNEDKSNIDTQKATEPTLEGGIENVGPTAKEATESTDGSAPRKESTESAEDKEEVKEETHPIEVTLNKDHAPYVEERPETMVPSESEPAGEVAKESSSPREGIKGSEEPKVQTEGDAASDPKPEGQLEDNVPTPRSIPEVQSESKLEDKSPETAPQSQPEEPDLETKPEPEETTTTQTELETEPNSEPNKEPNSEPETKPELETNLEPKPEPEPKSEPESEEPKSNPEPKSKPEPKSEPPKPESKPETKAESSPTTVTKVARIIPTTRSGVLSRKSSSTKLRKSKISSPKVVSSDSGVNEFIPEPEEEDTGYIPLALLDPISDLAPGAITLRRKRELKERIVCFFCV